MLDFDHGNNESIFNVNAKRIKTKVDNRTFFWHCRLGHVNEKRIARLHKDGLLDSFEFDSFENCESCLLGKMTKAPFSKVGERSNDLLELIHSDVCGPMSIEARGGYRYFVTFTDDHSRYGYIYLMRTKAETFEKFKEFQNEVENQLGKKIKAIRSDRGGEYLSYEFEDHLKDYGIVPQWTPAGTPQWNGVSERRNRTLLDMVRSMMSQTSLPKSFWGYALETAAYLLNRIPSKSVPKTPYEMWTGRIPKLSYIKIWGCEAYVRRLIADKLDPKSEKCLFVGYPKETKGYYFYHPYENKVFVARGGTFLEEEFISTRMDGNEIGLEEIREPQTNVVPMNVDPVSSIVEDPELSTQGAIRRSGRIRQEPIRYGFIVANDDEVEIIDDEPTYYREAMESEDSKKWQIAMKSEIQSMYDNQVWNLIDSPPGVKPVGCKWVFKKKTDMDGNVNTYKARLVAKGFKQIHGVDYDETFSPVAMLKSIRIILAIAAYYDYEI